jgi:hypothetical protein
MAKGWIRIYRQLQECEIWMKNQPFDMRSAWIDLLMFANHEDKQIVFDYKPLIIKRGQYLTSVRQLSARWKWDKERTLKYLRLLEQLGMITKDSNNRRTLITIENYEKYQGWQDTEPNTSPYTERTLNRTQDGHSTATNNNVKNEKNDNKYSSSFVTFWETYPKKSDKGQAYKCYKARLNDGWSEEELLIACQNYAAECKKDKRETRYIKNGSTFLSSTTPFTDYLTKGGNDSGRASRNAQSDEERIAKEQIRRIESGEESDERPFADM